MLFNFAGTIAYGALVLFAIAGCSTPKPATKSCCSAPLAAKDHAKDSLFSLDANWENDAAQKIQLPALRGRPQVIGMFFSKCEVVCPLTVENMRRVEASLPEELRQQLRFTLVSFDCESDTPAELSHFRAAHQLPADRWTLLRGTPAGVRELADRLGIQFQQDSSRRFRHTSQITVVDAEGRIIFRQEGLHGDLRAVVNSLKLSVAE